MGFRYYTYCSMLSVSVWCTILHDTGGSAIQVAELQSRELLWYRRLELSSKLQINFQ